MKRHNVNGWCEYAHYTDTYNFLKTYSLNVRLLQKYQFHIVSLINGDIVASLFVFSSSTFVSIMNWIPRISYWRLKRFTLKSYNLNKIRYVTKKEYGAPVIIYRLTNLRIDLIMFINFMITFTLFHCRIIKSHYIYYSELYIL